MRAVFCTLSTVLFVSLGTSESGGAASKIAMEEFMVPAADPGIQLYVRNKHPQGMKKFGGDKIVLFVHGATYPQKRLSIFG